LSPEGCAEQYGAENRHASQVNLCQHRFDYSSGVELVHRYSTRGRAMMDRNVDPRASPSSR
jgi:hypothetical protein